MSQFQDVAEIQRQANGFHYVGLIQFVILAYDYLLSFDEEVERFWKRDIKRLPAILFFVNRYLTLLGNIPILILEYIWSAPLSHDPEKGRTNLDLYTQSFIFVVQFNITVLFMLRVSALYAGSNRVKMFLGAIALGMVCNDVLQLYLADKAPLAIVDPSSIVGNLAAFTDSQGHHLAYLWIGIFVFDLSIFSLTLWRTIGMFKSEYVAGGIATVIMRDGLMYFGIITLSTLANILVFAFGPTLLKGLLPVFANILCSVMMSRLMLNLRAQQLIDTFGPTQASGIDFARFNETISHGQSST